MAETTFTCPICRRKLPSTELKTFPFCSDRCKLVDLGEWMDGGYAIPGADLPPSQIREHQDKQSDD